MTSHDMLSRFSIGKILISLVATESAVGPYWADWNETHIYNPSWTPHAKFHNGQTMSLGVGLALATFWELWRKHDTFDDALNALDSASLSASLYWLTQTSALSYPGAKAVDPPGTARFPQWKFALPSLATVVLGNGLERRRLRHLRALHVSYPREDDERRDRDRTDKEQPLQARAAHRAHAFRS